MKVKKYQKLQRLITNAINNKDLYTKVEDNSSSLLKERDDYYVEFMKHGDDIVSCGDANVISFVNETIDKKSVLTLILSLANRDDKHVNDSTLTSKIFEIIKVVEDLLGSFDYVRVQDSNQFTYLHIVKVLDPDVLFKLKLKTGEK